MVMIYVGESEFRYDHPWAMKASSQSSKQHFNHYPILLLIVKQIEWALLVDNESGDKVGFVDSKCLVC